MLFEAPEQRKPIGPLSIEDLTEDSDGEARIPDWRLAEVLGFANARQIRELIERHQQTLERFGTLSYRTTKSTGGRPGSEYRLNFNQAIFTVIKSEARNAVPVQIHVVTIYGLWATGKLRPVDAETGTAIAVATAQTFQESPIVMGMLQGLLDQILSGQGDLSDRVASVQRSALEIQQRLGDIVYRRDAPERNIDIYDRVLGEFYVDRCPCCGKYPIIIGGEHTASYRLDHATDHPSKNSLYEMWPVCDDCNRKFKNKPLYRAETMDAFRLFQRRVAELMGKRLL